MKQFTLSPDDKWLLAGGDGSFSLWEIETGRRKWEKAAADTSTKRTYDMSFAADGKSCIACGGYDQGAIIFDTASGRSIAAVKTQKFHPISVALSPNGEHAAFIDADSQLYLFDVRTNAVTKTEIQAGRDVRYSADGAHLACCSNNSRTEEYLRIVSLNDALEVCDFGDFRNIHQIRPLKDGSFVASGEIGSRYEPSNGHYYSTHQLGVQVLPVAGLLKEIWKHPRDSLRERIDFLPDCKIGVSTDYRLVTEFTDLQNGGRLQKIDHSFNYERYTRASLANWRLRHEVRDDAGLSGRIIMAVARLRHKARDDARLSAWIITASTLGGVAMVVSIGFLVYRLRQKRRAAAF
jgi:hypothetical protein